MNIVMTGGHSGIGFELAKNLLSDGHYIGLIVRSEERKNETRRNFSDFGSPDIFVADLSNRDAIENVSAEIMSSWQSIDGLFNNAGVLLDKLYFSDYGNELQLEINAISPYLLTKALQPMLEQSKDPFVVSTATATLEKKKTMDIMAFKKPTSFTKLTGSYIDSKLVLVSLMNYLSERHSKIRFLSVHPGAIKTKMTSGKGMPLLLKPLRNLFFRSPEFGALNLYQAAFRKDYPGTGQYISGNKVKPIKVKISAEEIEQLLQGP